MSAHESLSRQEEIKLPSNRSFGVVFGIFFALLGFWPLLKGGQPRWWACVLAAIFALLGAFNAPILTPLNRLWLRFGLLLHRIVSPVILAILYYGAVVPLGLLMRMSGKDPMRRRWEPGAASYWIPRDPKAAPSSMLNQF